MLGYQRFNLFNVVDLCKLLLMYTSRATKKYKWVTWVKSKTKALQHSLKATQYSGQSGSLLEKTYINQKSKFSAMLDWPKCGLRSPFLSELVKRSLICNYYLF